LIATGQLMKILAKLERELPTSKSYIEELNMRLTSELFTEGARVGYRLALHDVSREIEKIV